MRYDRFSGSVPNSQGSVLNSQNCKGCNDFFGVCPQIFGLSPTIFQGLDASGHFQKIGKLNAVQKQHFCPQALSAEFAHVLQVKNGL